MNFYFVFEGKTESIVYRKWLSVLLPNISEVNSYDEIVNNNFYYESDMGVPDCYNVVANAIQEINEVPLYDYLVLFVDADRYTIEEKKQEALLLIEEKLHDSKNNYRYKKLPPNCQFNIIVQKVCIETWFLGNKTFFIRNPQNTILQQYIKYFDVSANDPEALASEFEQSNDGTATIFGYSTKAKFHEGYLREIFKERLNGIAYNKSKPREVQEPTYLRHLQRRVKEYPSQLDSFQEMLKFCTTIQALMDKNKTN